MFIGVSDDNRSDDTLAASHSREARKDSMATQQTAPNNGTNVRGMREKINLGTLALNTPHALTLEGDGGVETPGQWGTQYRYMWSGNRISFVDPVIHELIQAQGACDGDSIKFWRLETRSGNRRGPVQYRVELVNTADDASDYADKPLASQPKPAAAAAAGRAPAPAARPAAPATAPPAATPAASPRQEQATEATHSVAATDTARLSAALVAAVDAAATAESYAEAHSRRVTFTSEDLRAMALTIYIGAARNGGRS